MATAFLALLSFTLLFVSPTLTKLTWSDFPSFQFFVNMVTYQVDHANLRHYLGNYMFMVPYALYLEYKLGSFRFLAFFFLCGFASAIVFWLSGIPSIGMIGSSGSAFGVFTAAALGFNDRWWKRWISFLGIGLVLGVQFQLAMSWNPFNMTAYWGHLGGAAAGAVLAYYMLPYIKKDK